MTANDIAYIIIVVLGFLFCIALSVLWLYLFNKRLKREKELKEFRYNDYMIYLDILSELRLTEVIKKDNKEKEN